MEVLARGVIKPGLCGHSVWFTILETRNQFMWSHLIGNVAIGIGVTIALLPTTEVLLSAEQKKWIRLRVEDYWLFLANQSKGRFLNELAKPGIKSLAIRVYYVFGCASAFMVSAPITCSNPRYIFLSQNYEFYEGQENKGLELLIYPFYLAVFGIFVHPFLFKMFMKLAAWDRDLRTLLIRTMGLAVVFTPIYLAILFMHAQRWGLDDVVVLGSTYKFVEWLAPLWLWLLAPLIAEFFALNYAIWLALAVLYGTATAVVLKPISEGFIWRIATYEKGPILAISALLGALGAGIKIFL